MNCYREEISSVPFGSERRNRLDERGFRTRRVIAKGRRRKLQPLVSGYSQVLELRYEEVDDFFGR